MGLPPLTKSHHFILIGAIAVVVTVTPSAYFFAKYQQAQRRLANPTKAVQEETQELVEKVGKLMVLPTDEEPTVAVISDASRLADQPFFARAQNGDKVLIYTNNKKAILYRPSVNKILDVAPVNLSSPSATAVSPVSSQVAGATTSAQPSPQVAMTFVLYNGTTVTGLTKTYEATLKAKLPAAKVVDRDNAKKQDYKKSLLVDLTSRRSADVASLAKTLGIEVVSLPKDEIKPTGADFLIIVGEDAK